MKRSLIQLWRALPFLLPNLLGFLIFTGGAVVASFYLSLTHWDLLTEPKFVGLQNYWQLVGWHFENQQFAVNDPEFWQSAFNTAFLMVGIPFAVFGAFGLAMVLNQKMKGEHIFRLIFFLPSIVSGVAIMLLWKWMFNADYGLINRMLWDTLGVQGPNWLTSVTWAKPALMMMGFWCAVGGHNMILYLAALQNIPKDLYEAADIDGASSWERLRKITWPMVAPTTFFILTMSIIAGFQSGFDAAYIMTGGGPARSTTTISYFIYNHAYELLNMGYASAASWVLFAIVFLFTLIHWKRAGKSAA